MKKIISLILSVVMGLSITTAFSVNAEEVQTSGKCGDNITWKFDKSTSTLYITGIGEMYDLSYGKSAEYSGIYSQNGEKIKNIIISDGIVSIGDYAFRDISSIVNFTFGKDIKTIGKYAFADLYGFEKLAIPDSVEVIGDWAFYNCGNLKEVTFGKNLKTIGEGAFDTCYRLEKVAFCDGIEEIGKYAFNQCAALKNITVPTSVTKIGALALGYSFDWDMKNDTSTVRPDKGFVLTAEYGSAAQQYAFKNGVNYNDVNGCETHTFGKKQTAIKKVCNKQRGMYYKQCKNCNSRRFSFKTKSHTFKTGSTKVVRKATFFKNGLKTKYCTYCKKRIKFKTYKYINEAFVSRKVYKDKVKFTLTNNQKGVTHYEVQLVKENGKYKNAKKFVVDKNSEIVFDGLKKNTNYEYRKRLVIKQGNKTAKGGWTYSWFTTKK